MEQSKQPLYKVLNEQRTQGEWNEDGLAIVGPRPEIEICVMTNDEDVKGEAYANAQYTALAVNNLHLLAEALEEMIKEAHHANLTGMATSPFVLTRAKEALNKIS